MFGFFQSRTRGQGDPFDAFLSGRLSANPSVSIEEVLAQYAQKYDLAAREHLDEPQYMTDLRTQLRLLRVLEGFVRDHPDRGHEPRFQKCLAELRGFVGNLAPASPRP
jgi:hypothetical protein